MQGNSAEQGPTVFISYAHENDGLRAAVRALADWLGERGCRVLTDQAYIRRPPERGWSGWMTDCIERADVVLVVCTPKLKDRYARNAPPETGRGATFEGAIVTQHMYDNAMRNTKFFPIMPDGGRYEDVPTTLRNWWNGHSFPSGNEGIRLLIFDLPSSGAGAAPPIDAVSASSSGWSVETRHQQMTARLLGVEGARAFLEALQAEMAEEFGLDPAPHEPVEIVRWFSQIPNLDEEILQLFDVVHRALLTLDGLPEGGRNERRLAEEAAAALYCLAACRLVERTAYKSGDYLLRVPRSEAVIYAVIATALFGGELRLKAAERVDLPTPEYVFDDCLPEATRSRRISSERSTSPCSRTRTIPAEWSASIQDLSIRTCGRSWSPGCER